MGCLATEIIVLSVNSWVHYVVINDVGFNGTWTSNASIANNCGLLLVQGKDASSGTTSSTQLYAFSGPSGGSAYNLNRILNAGSVQYSDGPIVSVNGDRKLQVYAGACFARVILISANRN